MKASSKVAITVMNPNRGLNTLIAPTLIKNEESPDLLNIDFVESGCPTKRPGSTQVGDAVGDKISGLGNLYISSTGVKHLLAVMGTTVRRLVGATWTTISGVTLTDGHDINFIQARDAIIGHNGYNAMIKFDGSTLNQPATGVVAKFGVFYSGHHFAAGNSSYPSRLYISNPKNVVDFTGSAGTATAGAATTLTDANKAWGVNDFAKQTIIITGGTGAGQSKTINSNTATVVTVSSAWTVNPDSTSTYTISTGNFIDIDENDGDKITGLAKWQDLLVIFKERSIYQLSFDASNLPVISTIIKGRGCVSHRSIDNVENDVFFLSREGVYVLGNEPNYFNTIRTNELSSRIHEELANIAKDNYDKCAGIFWDSKYILSVPITGSANNAMFTYDRRHQAWSKWTGLSANCWTIYIDPDNVDHLYFGDDSIGKVKEISGVSTDDGAAISARWKSKVFDLENFDRRKRWYDVTFLFRSIVGTVHIKINIDGTTVAKEKTIGQSATGSGGIGTDQFAQVLIGLDGGEYTPPDLITDYQPVRFKVGKRARTLQFEISNDVVNEDFTLMGYILVAKIFSHNNFPGTKY